jgi:hypothetical protein
VEPKQITLLGLPFSKGNEGNEKMEINKVFF